MTNAPVFYQILTICVGMELYGTSNISVISKILFVFANYSGRASIIHKNWYRNLVGKPIDRFWLLLANYCKFTRYASSTEPTLTRFHRSLLQVIIDEYSFFFSFLLIRLNFPKIAQYETRLITFILCTLQVEFTQTDTLPLQYDSLP